MEKTIFLRIPKTASTSIIKSGVFNSADIHTDVCQEYSNFEPSKILYVRTRRYINAIERVDDRYDLKTNNIYTFGFVRNPWDRLVSSWKYGAHQGRDSWNMEFRTFCRYLQGIDINPPAGRAFAPGSLIYHLRTNGYPIEGPRNATCAGEALMLHICEQHPFLICEKRGLRADFIGRFENLQPDFDTVCDKIGIPRQQLPHKNKTKHKHYTEYYDNKTRDIVAEKYARDIELFGYEFGK